MDAFTPRQMDWIQKLQIQGEKRKKVDMCDLGTCHDLSFGLTVARGHHQKQSDKHWLQLHVDRLCIV